MEWVELFSWHAFKMIFKSIWGEHVKNLENHSEIGRARGVVENFSFRGSLTGLEGL